MAENDRGTQLGGTIRSLLDIFPDPALLLSRERRVLCVNRAFTERFGADEKTSVGHFCHEVLHGGAGPCAEDDCPVQACTAGDQPAHTLHLHRCAEGEEHQYVTLYAVEPEGYLEILQPCRAASPRPHAHLPFGRSPAFNRMLELVHRVARTDTPVLLVGEPGTGKELVAASVHRLSSQGHGPFVPMDCSGRDEALLEHELFGLESQTSTGSASRTLGAVELAARGTLYLNQVAELPHHLQDQLLRMLETGLFRRVGGSEPLPARMRLVCGTHRDLRKNVQEGTFRLDLFHRIGTFPIPVPPLRERREDLHLLVDWMLEEISGGRPVEIRPDAMAMLECHPLPGNLRELHHLLERAWLLADGAAILPEHLEDESPAWPTAAVRASAGGDVVPLAELEARYLEWAVTTFEGDNAALAQRLGIGERTLYRKLRQLRKGDGNRLTSPGTEPPL